MTPSCITIPESSIKSTENVTPMSTKAISPTTGEIHGTSHASQETQKITTTGNLTRHLKLIAWVIQEHLVGVRDNETHFNITQTCTVLSMLQNNTAYRQKTWNKSWDNWTSSFKISRTQMTTKLSHARCDQRQNGRPAITWYTTISEITSTCSTTTQDEQVSHGQPLMKTEVPENITSLTHHSLANCWINSNSKNHISVCATATTKAQKVRKSATSRRQHKRNATKETTFTSQLHTAMPNYLRLSAKELPAFLDWPPLDHGYAHIQAKDEESQSSLTYLKRGETTQTETDLTTHTLHH